MLDLLQSLLPVVSGGIFGAFVKMWSMSQQDKADREKSLIEGLTKTQESQNQANEQANKNERFSMTRTIIALSITSVLVGAFWFGDNVSVPITTQTGGSYLFGLIDTSKEIVEYVTVNNVVLKDTLLAFQFIVGLYFGNNIATRR